MRVIAGGRVLSPTSPRGEARDIVIDGDAIVDIVAPGSVANENADVLDASRRLIIPGLINAHTHSHGGLSKGVGDLWSLELLLNAAPWISGSRSAEDKHLAALINAVEHVEKGATACYDLFFEFPAPTVEGLEAVASAYDSVGLRAVIAPMVADLTFYQSLPGMIDALPQDARARARDISMGKADTTIEALRTLAKRWSHPRDRLRLGVAPTIPHHCTKEFMIACRDVAREHGLIMQTHVGEARYQSASSFKIFGTSMTKTMDSAGIVGPWFSAAHAVWLDSDDMDVLAARGAQVAHNPARGLPPGEWLSTHDALRLATEGSARVLGFHDLIGKIAKGYKADLVLLDLDHVNYIPLNSATHQLVHTEDGRAIDKVLIGGRLVVSGGRAIGIDKAALAAKAQAAVDRLGALNADARRFAERIEPMVLNFCRGLADDEVLAGLHRLLPN